MKIRIATATEYVGESGDPVESFCLEVEGLHGQDKPIVIAETYLELREKLKEGIKEGK